MVKNLDPDPYKTFTDPKHCLKTRILHAAGRAVSCACVPGRGAGFAACATAESRPTVPASSHGFSPGEANKTL